MSKKFTKQIHQQITYHRYGVLTKKSLDVDKIGKKDEKDKKLGKRTKKDEKDKKKRVISVPRSSAHPQSERRA